MIREKSIFDEISKENVSKTYENRPAIIKKCLDIKKDVVKDDEKDFGIRQILNYGHTFAHAIEKNSNFEISHGHAVALGMKIMVKNFYESFYDDFIKDKEYKICKKMPDAYINKYIQELNEEKDDIDVLYKINKNGDMIEFCESWIKYIMENKNSILYLIKHKLISYLETKNPDDNKIEFKLGRKLATDKNLSF